MATSKAIAVEYGDHSYRGRYRLVGEMLHVEGASGTASALLNGQGSPELFAEMMLYGLAQTWSRNHSRGPQALSA